MTVIETCRSIEALCLDPYWAAGNRWQIEKLARDLREEVERLIEQQIREEIEALLPEDFYPSPEFQATAGLAT